MGGGSWSDADYGRSARGSKAFAYSDSTLAKSRDEWKIHQSLNPSGLKTRESRDSAEHPKSNAIMVGLDVTGSMSSVVRGIRDTLGKLMNMLLNGKYVPDPQLLFYAVGDATCDSVPFQIGQFESDIRINDQLTKVILESGGGGQNTESYELGFYAAARHTSIDCWEKRKRKGYLFTIGDEKPYSQLKKSEVFKIFDAKLQESVPLDKIVAEAQKTYHTFHIIPTKASNGRDAGVRQTWVDTLGGSQFMLVLDNEMATAELIALAIGMNERRLGFDEGLALVEKSSGQSVARSVREALQEFADWLKTQPDPAPVADDKDNAKKPAAADTKTKPKGKSGSKKGRI